MIWFAYYRDLVRYYAMMILQESIRLLQQNRLYTVVVLCSGHLKASRIILQRPGCSTNWLNHRYIFFFGLYLLVSEPPSRRVTEPVEPISPCLGTCDLSADRSGLKQMKHYKPGEYNSDGKILSSTITILCSCMHSHPFLSSGYDLYQSSTGDRTVNLLSRAKQN